MSKMINMIGEKYGKLLVIEDAGSSNGHKDWLCQCNCGKKIVVRGTHLRQGKIISCGCAKIERCKEYAQQQKGKVLINNQSIDLTGQQFGYLIVLEVDKKATLEHRNKSTTSNGQLYWKCQCKCGNIKSIAGNHLRKGDIKSCGCLNSSGELLISQLLRENNISFSQQVTFNDLKDLNLLKFDFAILNSENQIIKLIEFDGEQHFKPIVYWGGEEKFKIVQKHDEMKNQYCKDNNIKLLRISKIEDITLDNILNNETLL